MTEQAKLHANSTSCPHCGANLVGTEIPPASRELFGGHANFSRLIGIERDNDRIEAYKCPDCGAEDER